MPTIFPRKLIQPTNSFHYGEDSLLLASFALSVENKRYRGSVNSPAFWLDLGTGCGIVGIAAILLARSKKREIPFCLGLDCDRDLIDAAIQNASALGLSSCFTARIAEFADSSWSETVRIIRARHGRANLVVSNPPWRLTNSGRASREPSRRRALFGDTDTISSFVAAAASLLDPQGLFCCSVGASRLPDLLLSLRDRRFNPIRLLCVHPFDNRPAAWTFVAARRTGNTPLCVEAPLVLREYDGRYRTAALEFCPILSESVPEPSSDSEHISSPL